MIFCPVINGADPKATIKTVMTFGLIERYEEIIQEHIAKGMLREYISDFLSEKNKRYHGELCTKWFRTALQRQKPDMIEWFDRIQVLR